MLRSYRNKNRRRRLPHNVIRYLSKHGICSRSQAVQLVKKGMVRVNGEIVLDPGRKIGRSDKILVNEKPLETKEKKYILFHKPAGYVTTRKDELGRPTVYDILGDTGCWIFPVGRLDLDSEGLLIFTNDTKFGNALTDPRYNIERTYEIMVTGILSEEEINKVKGGIDIGRNEKARPTHIKILWKKGNTTYLSITLTEGKNREIRRIFERLDKPVSRLIRTRFGPFKLGSLKPGEWREIQKIPALPTQ